MADDCIGPDYHDTIRDRLMATQATPAARSAARSLLMEILRWSDWKEKPCEKSASELAVLLGFKHGNLVRSLKLLESVGAISRVRRGHVKIIMVTPNGVCRGEDHTEPADRDPAEYAETANRDLSDPAERARARKLRWFHRNKEAVKARRLAKTAGDPPSDPPAAAHALPTGRAA